MEETTDDVYETFGKVNADAGQARGRSWFDEGDSNYGWIECDSKSFPGQRYYYNVHSRCSTWYRPVGRFVRIPYFPQNVITPYNSSLDVDNDDPPMSVSEDEERSKGSGDGFNKIDPNLETDNGSTLSLDVGCPRKVGETTLVDLYYLSPSGCWSLQPPRRHEDLPPSKENRRPSEVNRNSSSDSSFAFSSSRRGSISTGCSCDLCTGDGRGRYATRPTTMNDYTNEKKFGVPVLRLKQLEFNDLLTRKPRRKPARKRRRTSKTTNAETKPEKKPFKIVCDVYGIKTVSYNNVEDEVPTHRARRSNLSDTTDSASIRANSNDSIEKTESKRTAFHDEFPFGVKELALSETSSSPSQ